MREVQERGAGEIVLNCMASDGVRRGYDVEQLSAVRELCAVPLVASGGAGAPEHFRDVFEQAGVDAALAASVFHSGAIVVRDLKHDLRRPASRCGREQRTGSVLTVPTSIPWTSPKATAWCPPSCRTPTAAPC